MKVSLFVTCLADLFYPEVGKSVVEVLEKYGVEVDFPAGQTCCGQPAFNSGYAKEAKKAARHMIEVFAESQYVVTPSGSCAAMIVHHYPKLFAGEPEWEERAKDLAKKTYEFTQFLVDVLKVENISARLPGKATYHHSCHMSRMLGVKEQPIQLLKQVEGLELVDLPYSQDCCGFGGTFSVKMPEISGEMVEEKAGHILETGAEYLIGSDLGCLMNIGGRLRRKGEKLKVLHIAQVLAGGEGSRT